MYITENFQQTFILECTFVLCRPTSDTHFVKFLITILVNTQMKGNLPPRHHGKKFD
jgi:hypothetical protein